MTKVIGEHNNDQCNEVNNENNESTYISGIANEKPSSNASLTNNTETENDKSPEVQDLVTEVSPTKDTSGNDTNNDNNVSSDLSGIVNKKTTSNENSKNDNKSEKIRTNRALNILGEIPRGQIQNAPQIPRSLLQKKRGSCYETKERK